MLALVLVLATPSAMKIASLSGSQSQMRSQKRKQSLISCWPMWLLVPRASQQQGRQLQSLSARAQEKLRQSRSRKPTQRQTLRLGGQRPTQTPAEAQQLCEMERQWAQVEAHLRLTKQTPTQTRPQQQGQLLRLPLQARRQQETPLALTL